MYVLAFSVWSGVWVNLGSCEWLCGQSNVVNPLSLLYICMVPVLTEQPTFLWCVFPYLDICRTNLWHLFEVYRGNSSGVCAVTPTSCIDWSNTYNLYGICTTHSSKETTEVNLLKISLPWNLCVGRPPVVNQYVCIVVKAPQQVLCVSLQGLGTMYTYGAVSIQMRDRIWV